MWQSRHADDHAHNPQQVAADHDGHHAPTADTPMDLPKFWADDIAVHLLDGNNQNQELESIKRVDEHQNQQTGD